MCNLSFIPNTLLNSINESMNIVRSGVIEGKYPIFEDKIFVVVTTVNTKNLEECQPEFHNNFVDIQILLEGEEVITFGHEDEKVNIYQDELATKDVAFCSKIQNEKSLHLMPGDFGIFYSGEIHRPGCSVRGNHQQIRKAIVKIHKDMLITDLSTIAS